MEQVHVATLNIRNLADRWTERLPLLLADMAALNPDILGLQEVIYPMQQDRLIGAAGEAHYRVIRGWAGRPEYGNSLLVREPLVGDHPERLDLGLHRSALRASIALAGGEMLLVVVTHLHHEVPDVAQRDDQARQLLDWLDGTSGARETDGPAMAPPIAAQVVMGDFNAHPQEAAAIRMRAAGFRSAYAELHGADPAATWPSGIQAPGMDTDGDPSCLDYIWIRGAVRVESARVVFDRPHPDDPTLFPSDHLGLSAHVLIGDALGAPPDRVGDR